MSFKLQSPDEKGQVRAAFWNRLAHVFDRIRAVFLFAAALLLAIIALTLLLRPLHAQIPAEEIAYEHRFTALETKIDAIQKTMETKEMFAWIQYAGLAGLLGEAGLRVVKNRRERPGA